MKFYLIKALIIFILLIFLPFICFISDNTESTTDIHDTQTTNQDINFNNESENTEVKVLRVSSGEIETVTKKEYLIGVIANEMPAGFHKEALKAQAVASNTYLKWIKENKESEKEDISDSSMTHQGFLSKEEMKEKWGESFNNYYSELSEIVEEVGNEYLIYNGKIALSAFHTLSAGATNTAENAWNMNIPYLTSVSAPGDTLSADLDSTVSYTPDELSNIIEEQLRIDVLNSDNSVPVSIIDASEDGYVINAEIYGKSFTGEQIKKAFSLKSSNFTVEVSEDKIVFSVKGKGHGVGMSQYSADFMARQGSNYKEILAHFYKGTEIAHE